MAQVHLGIEAPTLEMQAMEVADNSIGDAPALPALLDQIHTEEQIASISGDCAYDTKDYREAIALRAAHGIIPTRKNAKPWKTTPQYRCTQRYSTHDAQVGVGDMKKMERYRRSSLVETKICCSKLLRERVMERDFERQIAELQCGRLC